MVSNFFRIHVLQEYFYLRFTNFIGVIKVFKFYFSLNSILFLIELVNYTQTDNVLIHLKIALKLLLKLTKLR